MSDGLSPDLAAKPLVNPDIVKLLEDALKNAREGYFVGVAVVVVLPSGMPAANMAGAGAVEMNTGCDILKAQLMRQMMGPVKPSPILRPGH